MLTTSRLFYDDYINRKESTNLAILFKAARFGLVSELVRNANGDLHFKWNDSMSSTLLELEQMEKMET